MDLLSKIKETKVYASMLDAQTRSSIESYFQNSTSENNAQMLYDLIIDLEKHYNENMSEDEKAEFNIVLMTHLTSILKEKTREVKKDALELQSTVQAHQDSTYADNLLNQL